MDEMKPQVDDDVLMEIIALAEGMMGDKFGKSEKPSEISMEVSSDEPMMKDDSEEEENMEQAHPSMPSEMEVPEDEDEFELRKNKRIF